MTTANLLKRDSAFACQIKIFIENSMKKVCYEKFLISA